MAITAGDLPTGGTGCYDVRVEGAAGTIWASEHAVCTTPGGPGIAIEAAACDPSVDVDADRAGVQNTVSVSVSGLYDGDGAEIAGWIDPCADGCRFTADCDDAQPTRLDVDLTVARRDDRGLFDAGIAVGGMVCSARYDCAAGAPTQVAGETVTRQLLGFACVGPLDAQVDPVLYLDPIVVTCDDGWGPKTATIDPEWADAEDTDPLTSEDASWPGVAFTNRFDSLQRVSARTGTVDGQVGLIPTRTRYWNVAIDLRGDLTGCTVTARGTMDDATRLGGASAGVILADQVYPYVDWTVELGTCNRDHLLDRPDSGVTTRYFAPGSEHRFSHSAPWGYASCEANAECPGAVCVDGACQDVSRLGGACDDSEDCGSGGECSTGICVLPPLRISPATVSVPVGGASTFEALGGEGGYVFELASGPGRLEGSTYIAPSDRDGTAVVRVRDAAGEVREAVITVTGEPLTLTPNAAWVPVGMTHPFAAAGGVPPYRYEVVAGQGTVDAVTGLYVAPAEAGTAMIHVTDARGTGANAIVHITP
ncbi:MAG: hypothetical protein EP329_21100 [Deltaproteobacteria bacterium]|nr:MAG: hypothetical protein EP329_21100 [Deltaproteobacteria bacterium]